MFPLNDAHMILIWSQGNLIFYHQGIPKVLGNAQPPEGIHFISWRSELSSSVRRCGKKTLCLITLLMALVDDM